MVPFPSTYVQHPCLTPGSSVNTDPLYTGPPACAAHGPDPTLTLRETWERKPVQTQGDSGDGSSGWVPVIHTAI